MSSEQLFREILLGDTNTVVLPGVDLKDQALSLDGLALARLFVDLLQIPNDASISDQQRQARSALHDRFEQVKKVFRPDVALRALEVINAASEERRSLGSEGSNNKWMFIFEISNLSAVLEELDGDITDEIRACIKQCAIFRAEPYIQSFALSAIAGKPLPTNTRVETNSCRSSESLTKWVDSNGELLFFPAQLSIINTLAKTDFKLCLRIARRLHGGYDERDSDTNDLPGELLYAKSSEFVKQSRPAIEKAVELVDKIHSGEIPFKADSALSRYDAHALACFVSVALDRDDTWLPSLLRPLLTKLSVAPIPTAKTSPSQSAAYSIACAIAERPTISSWLVLKEVSTLVRHAALKKRMVKCCKNAEKKLTAREGFLRQWPQEMAIPKTLLPGVKRSLEMMLINTGSLTGQQFHSLLATEGMDTIMRSLVWSFTDSASNDSRFVIAMKGKQALMLDANENEVSIVDDAFIELLYPSQVDEEELELWRSWCLKKKIKQPFNQLFRETYHAEQDKCDGNISSNFASHIVDGSTLIGLSNSVGWKLSQYEGFKLEYNEYSFVLDSGGLYPGYHGTIESGQLRAYLHGKPIDFSDLPPRIFSEAYRATDLLISVAAFAATKSKAAPDKAAIEFEKKIGVSTNKVGFYTAVSRQELLKRLYPGGKDSEIPYVDGRYLVVGDIRIHCATGRVSTQGKTIELEPSKKVVQLPYPDKVLERIIKTVNAISDVK